MAPCLKVILTGFGPFEGMPFNPTQRLCEWLATQPSLPESCCAEVLRADTLCVAAQDVDEWMVNKLCPHLEQASAPDCTILVLHLGVHGTARCILLEQCAANMAHFRCPDQRGLKLSEPIDGSCTQDSIKTTGLHLDLACSLLSVKGHNVEVSCDAGRFLCNWVYYRSLGLCSHNNEEPMERRQQKFGQQSGQQQQQERPQPEQQQHGLQQDGQEQQDRQQQDGQQHGEQTQGASTQHLQPSHTATYSSQPASEVLHRYRSILQGKGARCYSLFVHVPSFDIVPEEVQRRCLQDLLLVLSRALFDQGLAE